jgi:signal transduction histidine kinase
VFALLPAGLVLAALAASFEGHSEDGSHIVTDLAVGWVFIACGVVATSRRPANRFGILMAAIGFAWLLGSIAPAALYLHRGPLVQVLLAFPTGRLRGRIAQATVFAAYVDGAVEPIGRLAPVTVILAVSVVLVATWGVAHTSGPERRGRAAAATAALALAVVLVPGSLGRLLNLGLDVPVLWAYQLVLATLAIGLTVDLLRGGWARATVTDLVVNLGERAQSGLLRDRLAAALGDPTLVVGYWVGEPARYVDEAGRPVRLPTPGSGRTITRVGSGDERIGVLVHDDAILNDPLLVESVAEAARIALVNARLQAEIQGRVTELAASRRRIVEAADGQRWRLERELRAGAAGRLVTIEQLLAGAEHAASGPLAVAIGAVNVEVRGAAVELHDFARGVYPAFLTDGGLAPAVRELAHRAPLPVSVDIPDVRLPAFVESTGYFVCSEALANVAKHAAASGVSITARSEDGRLRLTVSDDGVGGADPGLGSGLRGLVDRVEAIGGRIRVESPPGQGTRLLADLPLS